MSTQSESFFEKRFRLSANGTDAKTEIMAGITTFFSLAYILAVNPQILSETGMDSGSVFTATILASIVATLLMAFYANYPFVLCAGMGLNAYFAYVVVIQNGHDWQFALTAVFIEGIIFLLLTFLNVREAIVNAIPMNMKNAVSVGIGLFIAFIGLKSANIIVNDDATFVKFGGFSSPEAIACLIGLIVIAFLQIRNVKGSLLIGIIVSTIAGIPLGITKLDGLFSLPPSVMPTALAFKDVGLSNILTADMFTVVVTFLFVDLFDTIGTLVGTASKANMLDEEGKLPNVKQALFADAVGTTVGAMLGTSTITTCVESASGIAEGGRTGLTSFTAAVLFAISLFLAPLFTAIPAAATAPALIAVGLFMVENITKIDFSDFTEALPAFLTIIMMPLAYSIGDGLMIGIISYSVCKILAGKFKESSIVMYILAVLFILKIIFMT